MSAGFKLQADCTCLREQFIDDNLSECFDELLFFLGHRGSILCRNESGLAQKQKQRQQQNQKQRQTQIPFGNDKQGRKWLEAAEGEVVADGDDEPEDGGGQEEGVDAVEDAAVAGEEGAGVFDACAALERGFEEVSELGGGV